MTICGVPSLLVFLLAIAPGCTSKRMRPVKIVNESEVVRCERLKEVSGHSLLAIGFGMIAAAGQSNARNEALRKASDLGATHMVWLPTSSSASARGVAYLCGESADVQKIVAGSAVLTEVVGAGATNVRTIAVPALKGTLTDRALCAALTEVIVIGAAKRKNTTVISHDEIEAILEHERSKDLLGCEDSAACYAEIGGALGVDALLVASVNPVGSSYLASFKLIDVRRAEVALRSTATVRAPPEHLLPAFEEAVRNLMERLDRNSSKEVR